MQKLVFFSLMFIVALILSGCCTATTSRTATITTSEEQTAEGNKGNFPGGAASEIKGEYPAFEAKKTTEVKAEEKKGRVGILGTTIHLIGQILAFPFKLIGGLIELIF